MESVPEWADRRCSCGAYLDETDETYPVTNEHGDEVEVCEGCQGAIAAASRHD